MRRCGKTDLAFSRSRGNVRPIDRYNRAYFVQFLSRTRQNNRSMKLVLLTFSSNAFMTDRTLSGGGGEISLVFTNIVNSLYIIA